MSTAYYWRDRPCGGCGRYDEIHVSTSGRTFHAYRHALMNAEHPDWGYDPASPVGFPVLSVADWVRVFKERPGELWDEYGERIDDPVAWLAQVKPPTMEERERKLQYWDSEDHWDERGYHMRTGAWG